MIITMGLVNIDPLKINEIEKEEIEKEEIDLFVINLFGILWASWIWMSIFLSRFRKFSVIISLNKLSAPFSLLVLGLPQSMLFP